jgi:RNA polymerase sigma factor (sigma-70 family)
MESREESVTDELETFCQERYPRLVRFLSLYCGSLDTAEELAQDALMRAVRDWRRVRTMDSPEAWIHRVALNLANSFFRRRAAETRANQRIGAELKISTEPATVGNMAVRQAVAGLPRRQKTALTLRYFAGFSVRETAGIMDCPEGTVKILTHRAIATLRGLPETQGLREAMDGR